MSRMRSSMSKKNKWYIDPERYLELKHYCKQYPGMMEELSNIKLMNSSFGYGQVGYRNKKKIKNDLTAEDAIRRSYLEDRLSAIINSAKNADKDIWPWIIAGVTQDLGYDILKARGIPCGKDYYYEAYHKFFYILDKERK